MNLNKRKGTSNIRIEVNNIENKYTIERIDKTKRYFIIKIHKLDSILHEMGQEKKRCFSQVGKC